MPGPVFLDGETVSLRTIEKEDLPRLQEVVNDRRIWRAIGSPHPVNEKQEEEFFEETVCSDDSIDLLITVAEEAVGMVSLWLEDGDVSKAELGYWLDPAHQRNGYASEAATLLVDHGFEQLGLHRIEARVFEFNEPSQKLLERLGFEQEGRHREATFVDGEYQDIHWYSVLEDEWEST